MIPSKCIFFQRLFCMICLVAGIAPLHAQRNYAVSAIPLACLPAADAVVRFADTRYTFEGPGKAVFSKTIAVTVLNESGKNRANLIQPENKFIKIKTMQGRLYSASGLLVRTSSKSDIQEQSLSDRQEFLDVKLKGLVMEYPSYPFTVEYTIEYSMEAFFLAPSFTIQHLAESVESTTFTLAFPKDYRFKWKMSRGSFEPEKTSKGDMQVWTWKAALLPAVPNEVFTPFFDDSYIEIEIAPEQVLLDKSSGNFSNWLEVGRFFYNLNKDRDQLSPQMQKQVADVTASLSTPEDKIKALYRFLQEQTRYVSIQVGVGGWQTFDAQFVEEKKYGDCKALTNFMKAMLKSAGITAHQALVYAGDEGAPELSEDMPLPRFNHVILYIPEVNYWLECTSRDFPANYLGTFTADRQVLLLTDKGGELKRTPKLSDTQNTRTSTFEIAVDETGNALIQRSAIFTGALHEYYRTAATQPDLEKKFMENLDFTVLKVHQLAVKAAPVQDRADLSYRVDASKYASKAGKRLFVPLTKASPFGFSLPADTSRVHELRIPEEFALVDTFIISIPQGYVVENLPGNKTIQSAFGEYRLELEKNDQQVKVMRHITKKEIREAATAYVELRKQILDISKLDGSQMVLVKKE